MKIGPTALIRLHLYRIPSNKPFSTRDFLSYGLRNSIDQALNRMVKNQQLIRLTRGIFIKWATKPNLPSAFDVATTKARAFGKELLIHGAQAAQKFGITADSNKQPIFGAMGRTTAFAFENTKIHLKGISPRDAKLLDSLPGQAIRAIRQMRRKCNVQRDLAFVMSQLGKIDRTILRESAWLMPDWMSNALIKSNR